MPIGSAKHDLTLAVAMILHTGPAQKPSLLLPSSSPSCWLLLHDDDELLAIECHFEALLEKTSAISRQVKNLFDARHHHKTYLLPAQRTTDLFVVLLMTSAHRMRQQYDYDDQMARSSP
jgi:hypothetical protein